jgi:hypothetical protein
MRRTYSKRRENFKIWQHSDETISSLARLPLLQQQEDIHMAEVRYLVTKRNGEWKINLGSSRMGPYRDKTQAIETAIDMADRDGRNGRDSQVLVRGEDRQFLIEWTYGRDPYPDSVAFD